MPAACVLVLAVSCGAPADSDGGESAAGPVWFEEQAAERGIDFLHRSGYTDRFYLPEIMGGGAALFDMDGDGDLDAYLGQSGSLTDQAAESRNRLYANDGAGRFHDVSASSGADDPGYAMGVAVGDYDDDGDPDLYVTNYGPNALLRNEGGGRFTDVTRAAGVGDPSWSASAAFLDYDRDGDLDLFVANYVNWTVATEQDCYNPSGVLDYCLLTNYNAPATDRLYRNDGAWIFTDVTVEAGLRGAFGNGLGVLAADFSGDGLVDVFVANDTMMNQLWINQGDGTFRDEALVRGCALDEHGLEKAGMGVGAGDVDGDGDEDLLVVNLEGQSDSFFRNDDGWFSDATGTVGMAASSRGFTRFGAGLVDFDNDGWFDIYQANGRVMRSGSIHDPDDPFAEPNTLYRGMPDGRFVETAARGGTSPVLIETSRAAAFGDVDGDGGIDILVSNRDAAASLLINVVPDRGAWVAFRVLEEHGRDALGAAVFLTVGERRLRRDVRAAYGYCSSSDPRVFVGLGTEAAARTVEVRWVDGTIEIFGDFDAGSVATLRQGDGRTR